MLQILLAVLAITLVSVSGWTLVEQVHLQQVVTDQRETMRRLDVSAEAISGSLKSLPGKDGVFALAPSLPQGGFLQMPNGIGGLNSNSYGVPFHYCPVVRKLDANGNFTGYAMADAPTDGIVVQPQAGVVIDAGSSIPQALASFNPIAFITASKSGDAPPSCNAIDIVDGKPHVAAGMVRVVSRPNGALAQNATSKDISDLYTAPGASGSGRFQDDPAAIDDVLEQFARYRPSSMTLHVSGVVTPSSRAWSDFVGALNGNGSALTIVGDSGGGSAIEGAAGGNLPAPGTLVLQNIGMPVNVVVGPNSSANFIGSLMLANGGVVAAGAQSISSSGSTIATPNGNCWSSGSGDLTFAYSIAPNSSVPGNPAAPSKPVKAEGESDDDYQTAVIDYDQRYDAWRDQVTALETARQTNHSSFTCATAVSG